ncbi:Uncharacterised protein [Raoultella planticola]|uniref:Uncharacterized protein n=1 Tax=Raoultella planticola TaxID=575 RepID=A0A485AHV2_RAOPL|nr:Uncharacterised protein [Raoultella planticola]
MISKEAIKRGYNRGNYLAGVHTPPGWAAQSQVEGRGHSLQRDPVTVSESIVDQLRSVANEVLTARHDVLNWTRDWWAGSMIAETDGNPATPNCGYRPRLPRRAGSGGGQNRPSPPSAANGFRRTQQRYRRRVAGARRQLCSTSVTSTNC